MKPLERECALNAVWKGTPSDYRAYVGGQRYVLVLREGGTRLVPLRDLTDDELQRKARRAK